MTGEEMEVSREEVYTDEEWNKAESKAKRIAGTYISDNDLQTKYKTAIVVSLVNAGIGWIVVAIGIVSALVMYSASPNGVFLLAGLGISIFGLLIVAAGQVISAAVDTANNTARIVQLLHENPKL